jgi:hypothetical protein
LAPHETAVRQLAILRVGQWFEGRADDPDVEATGERFSTDAFYGDDVMVTKQR